MRRRSYAWRFLPALHRWRPPILHMLAAVLRSLRLRLHGLRLLDLIVPLR